MAGGACVARGHALWGVCMAGGGMHGGGHPPPGRYYGYGIRSMSGRYASYWNAFLFAFIFTSSESSQTVGVT